MANFMTIEEFHYRLGKWLQDNPEHKNELIAEATVVHSKDENSLAYSPGSILFGIAHKADDNNYDKIATLSIVPPKVGKFVS